jgi:hypothetical protein
VKISMVRAVWRRWGGGGGGIVVADAGGWGPRDRDGGSSLSPAVATAPRQHLLRRR